MEVHQSGARSPGLAARTGVRRARSASSLHRLLADRDRPRRRHRSGAWIAHVHPAPGRRHRRARWSAPSPALAARLTLLVHDFSHDRSAAPPPLTVHRSAGPVRPAPDRAERRAIVRDGLGVGLATGAYGVSFGAVSVAAGPVGRCRPAPCRC